MKFQHHTFSARSDFSRFLALSRMNSEKQHIGSCQVWIGVRTNA